MRLLSDDYPWRPQQTLIKNKQSKNKGVWHWPLLSAYGLYGEKKTSVERSIMLLMSLHAILYRIFRIEKDETKGRSTQANHAIG